MVQGGKAVDKKPLIGVSIIAVVLLVLGSLTNVVGYQMVQSSDNPPRLTVDIITYKQRFPRIYLDSSYFNATIIVTNNGLDTFDEFGINILLMQFPPPRVPNEYWESEFNLTLEPNESYAINFSCKPSLGARGHFGIFPLDVYIKYDNESISYGHKIFIIFDPILNDGLLQMN